MIRMIITVLFVALFLICSIPIFIVEWIMKKINPHAADMSSLRIVQWAFRVVALLSGVKLTVIGEENVPQDEAVLYVANHRSFFDIVVTYARCPGLTGFIAKPTIMKVPLLGVWMKRLYCLSIDRENNREALKTILKGIEQLKNGISMYIFPEGTRCKEPEGTLLKFKEGSMKLAEKSGCRIVPVAIINSDAVFERQFPRVRSAHVTVVYGEPIDTKVLSKEEKKTLGAMVQGRIVGMIREHMDPA